MNERLIINMYIASCSDSPEETIFIDKKPLKYYIEQFNKINESRKIFLKTVTNKKFLLKNIHALSLDDELSFHILHPLCIIDGTYIKEYKEQILTVRAHHFPYQTCFRVFCIAQPFEALSKTELENIENEEEAINFILRNYIHFDESLLIPPKSNEFLNSLTFSTQYFKFLKKSEIINIEETLTQ